MHSARKAHSRGFTIIEILVVVGIIAIVSAIAIPGLVKLGAFSRDEFKRTVSQVDSILRAAEIYATTYHVNTAVVYNMDNYNPDEAAAVDTLPLINPFLEDPGDPAFPITTPVIDSLTGASVRQIEAAAIMYQLPASMGSLSGLYVPIPGDLGEFQTFPPGMAIMLQDPTTADAIDPSIYEAYYWEDARSNYRSDATINQVGSLGMDKITAALGVPVGMDAATYQTFTSGAGVFVAESFAAHVFRPSGRLSVPDAPRERFTLYIAPSAERPLEERLLDPEIPAPFLAPNESNLVYRRIYLHKSTGRTSIPDAF